MGEECPVRCHGVVPADRGRVPVPPRRWPGALFGARRGRDHPPVASSLAALMPPRLFTGLLPRAVSGSPALLSATSTLVHSHPSSSTLVFAPFYSASSTSKLALLPRSCLRSRAAALRRGRDMHAEAVIGMDRGHHAPPHPLPSRRREPREGVGFQACRRRMINMLVGLGQSPPTQDIAHHAGNTSAIRRVWRSRYGGGAEGSMYSEAPPQNHEALNLGYVRPNFFSRARS